MDISPLLSSSIDWHGSDFWNWQQDKEDDKEELESESKTESKSRLESVSEWESPIVPLSWESCVFVKAGGSSSLDMLTFIYRSDARTYSEAALPTLFMLMVVGEMPWPVFMPVDDISGVIPAVRWLWQ